MNDDKFKGYKGLPKTVRIGCYTYDVGIMHGDDADIAEVAGATSGLRQMIRVRPHMKPQQLANTFMHEVLHAIHYVYGLKDGDEEEKFTNQTANGLCAFWQDNPEACRWWVKLLECK